MPTAAIALVREHAEAIRPPRALWVPFELGRPLGVPGDRDFQMAVLRALLALFGQPVGPVLLDYPVEAPSIGADEQPWSCPLPLPALATATTDLEQLSQRLAAEIALLRPWYEESLRSRGRTSIGVSGLSASDMEALARVVASAVVGRVSDAPPGANGSYPLLFRFIVDDLKAFYLEAASAQPAKATPSAAELAAWLYRETALGDALFSVRDRMLADEAHPLRPVVGALIPAAHARRP